MNGFILRIPKPDGNDIVKPILGVGYDLEGTTVNLEELHWQAHRKVANLLGVDLPQDFSDLLREIPHIVGGPDSAVMEDIRSYAQRLGMTGDKLSEWPVESMLKQKMAAFSAAFRYAVIEPRTGVTNVMNLLENSVPYGICSVTQWTELSDIIERAGLLPMLSGRPVIYHDGNTKPKPDPEVYERFAKQLGIHPEHLLVFEDSPTGVRSAHRAGATVIAVPIVPAGMDATPEETIRRLNESGADLILPGWHEVYEYLIENLYELREDREGDLSIRHAFPLHRFLKEGGRFVIGEDQKVEVKIPEQPEGRVISRGQNPERGLC